VSRAHRLVSVALLGMLFTREAHADSPASPTEGTDAQADTSLLPARIDAVLVHGLVRTKEWVVLRELPWRVGEVVTPATFDLGIARLWDTTMFSHVDGHVVHQGLRTVAVIDLEERWPIRPLIEFQSGGSATWIHVGISDRNIFGLYLESEAFYEYFNGQSGGRAWFRDARLFDQRLELRVVVDALMRPRPAYTVRTTRGRIELNHQTLGDLIKYGLRIDALNDDFFPPLDGTNPPLPGSVHAVIAEPGFRIGRVDTIRLRDTGFSLEMRPALGTTSRTGAPFRRLWFELNANAIAGERWNFGLRSQLGSVTNQPDEMQFFIGGLDLLRGYPDNYFQANAYGLYNADIKYVVFDSTWLAVIPNVFSDGAAIRRMDGSRDAAVSLGGGFILVIPKFADSQLRIDVGVPLRAPYTPGLGLGSSVFF
jgi:hypothetical protein